MQRCDHCPIARQEMPLFLCVVLDGGDDTRKLAVLTRPTLRHCAPKFRGVSARPTVRNYIYILLLPWRSKRASALRWPTSLSTLNILFFYLFFTGKKVHFLKIKKFIIS